MHELPATHCLPTEQPGLQHYASRPHRADDMHPGRAYDCPECAHRYRVKPLMDKFVRKI